jgi:hypothetical protein
MERQLREEKNKKLIEIKYKQKGIPAPPKNIGLNL